MSDMDRDETRATQKLYNPANIDKMIEKCNSNQSDSLTFYEPAEQDLVKEALKTYRLIGSKENLANVLDRMKTRMIELRQNTDMYIEPNYWQKEIYGLGTLEYVLYGKVITDEKVLLEKDKEFQKAKNRNKEDRER